MTNKLAADVAGEIRAEMGRQRRSGVWLAAQLGVSQSRLARRLVGDVPLDLAELEEIASALDVPITQFIFGRSEGSSRPTTDRYVADNARLLVAA